VLLKAIDRQERIVTKCNGILDVPAQPLNARRRGQALLKAGKQ
jgi:hypothetical protein